MVSRFDLISGGASVSQFESFLNTSALQDQQLLDTTEREDLSRRQAVHTWLKPTDMENEQDYLVSIRAGYPYTCRWLLHDRTFKEWFHPQYTTLPTLLWLNGKPGAGKFTLTSRRKGLKIIINSQSLYRKDGSCITGCRRGEKARTSPHSLVLLLQAGG